MDTDVLITESDDTELTSATVALTNHDTDDVWGSPGHCRPASTASAYNSATGILTLTGTASLTAYQTALQQITFDNTGTTPSTATRVIDIVVNDGAASNSNTAKAFIQVEVVNNIALRCWTSISNDPGGSVRSTFRTEFTENGGSGADRRRGYLHKIPIATALNLFPRRSR